jgi:hypothetical protein
MGCVAVSSLALGVIGKRLRVCFFEDCNRGRQLNESAVTLFICYQEKKKVKLKGNKT